MEQTETYLDIMKESLERKKLYLRDILSLTKEQAEIIKKSDFDDEKFEAVMSKKEILINNINEIDKGFTAVYDRVRSDVMDNKEVYRDVLVVIQQNIRQCVDYGMQIEALEERNRTELEKAFSVQRKGVKCAKQSRHVANKYYKTMSNGAFDDSTFYDTKK